MEIDIYQVDAFATKVFEGNPAAVCPLETWIPDELLQNIANENNLSETAFFVATPAGYELRWFTPEAEVDLCGHATLAAAHVLYKHLNFSKESINFETRSGELIVTKVDHGYSLNFPASKLRPIETPQAIKQALGLTPFKTLVDFDYIVVLENQAQLESLIPDFALLKSLDKRGVVVTAPGDQLDFVSRCFFPKYGVDEDPVTGSAHCELTPYWSKVLNKTKLKALQLSKRSGLVECELLDNRVLLSGSAVDYMHGTIWLDD